MSAKQRAKRKHQFAEEGPDARCMKCGQKREYACRPGRFTRCECRRCLGPKEANGLYLCEECLAEPSDYGDRAFAVERFAQWLAGREGDGW